MPYKEFGDLVRQIRTEHGMTTRDLAAELGCSAPYLIDVEHGRRNPFDNERLQKFAELFNLSEDKRDEMYDLAGLKRDEIAPDLPDYIKPRPYVNVALRTARDIDAGEEDWNWITEQLLKRKGRRLDD